MNAPLKPPFVPGPVTCARNFNLSDSSSAQPIMTEATLDWFRPMAIGIVDGTIQDGTLDATMDGVVKETIRWVETSGCVQPGAGEKLDVKAEGERSWDSALLHTSPDFNVETGTIVVVKGVRYEVMVKNDFSANGFCRYELLQTYARSA